MRVKALGLALFTAGAVVALGCHHDKYQLASTAKEECVLPPDDPRFNQPPTQEYRKRPPKPEDKSMMGGAMGRGPIGAGLNPNGF